MQLPQNKTAIVQEKNEENIKKYEGACALFAREGNKDEPFKSNNLSEIF